MRLPILAAVAASAAAAPVHAQETPQQAADAYFAPRVPADAPGCAVAASQAGKKVLDRAYGMADLEHGVPNTPGTVFEAGSASKQFTAAAILLLAEEGKLALTDDIRKYLPEIRDYGSPIAIDHLLHHTNGMRDWRFVRAVGGQMIGYHVSSNADALDTATRQRALNHAPGAEYAYTNTGYNLAAVIVERVSGKTLAQYSKEKIFDPLGMGSTQWRDDFRRIVKNRAVAYSASGGGFKWDMPFENAYGAGGLLTTTGDLLLWNQALDDSRLGPRVTARLQEQGSLTSGAKTSYARGLFIQSYRGTREVSHGGVTLGYVAFLARFPEHQVSVAVLCNRSSANPSEIAHHIADRLLPANLSAPAPTPATAPAPDTSRRELWRPAAAELRQLVGRYRSDEAGATYLAEVKGERLVLRLEGDPDTTHSLSPTYRDTFVFVGGSIRFERTKAGAAAGMSLSASRIRGLPFQKIEAAR
jgi:CubicO group peptidase (beta-lactamase class C family)